MGALSFAYATRPLTFTAQADSPDASLEIVGNGQGSFRVGAVSLMPADNIEGFRAEVIAAFKQLRSGVYRFPGGNFVSAHGRGTLWRMAPSSVDATIVVGQKPGVEVEELALDAVPITPTFAPFSVNVYEFPVKQ